MRVIADLHGGDPEDIVARAEFQEIKERVLFEVSPSARMANRLVSLLCPEGERRRENVRRYVETIQAPCIACHVVSGICTTCESCCASLLHILTTSFS